MSAFELGFRVAENATSVRLMPRIAIRKVNFWGLRALPNGASRDSGG